MWRGLKSSLSNVLSSIAAAKTPSAVDLANDRTFLPSTGSVNGTATGALPGVTLTAPNATATGTSGVINGNATGTLPSLTLTAPNATATGTSGVVNGNASGTLPTISLIAPNATATGTANGTATGSLPAITLTAPTATATGTTGAANGNASGSLPGLTLTAPNATATGTGLPVLNSGGGIVPRQRRHTTKKHNETVANAKKEYNSENKLLPELQRIVDATPSPTSEAKAAFNAVKNAQQELEAAQLRLIQYLVEQEQAIDAQNELEIVRIIAELL